MPFADVTGREFTTARRARRAPILLMSIRSARTSACGPADPHARRTLSRAGYDSRGHGQSAVTNGPYDIAQLARDALGLLDALRIDRANFCGLSMGGMVGQWLGANAPQRIGRLALCNTGAQVGTPDLWNARIDAVMNGGMAAIVDGVIARWYTPAFVAAAPDAIARTRNMLLTTPANGYIASCAAVRDMDQRASAGRIVAPTLVIAGTHDAATPPAAGRFLADTIAGAKYVELAAAHLSNVEAEETATSPHQFCPLSLRGSAMDERERHDNGMKVRRAVLGDAHVDRTLKRRDDFNSEFQELITRYAWGEIWTRPGLPRHTRSLLTVAMMVALNRTDEFKLHVRAAFNNGVTRDEIKEVLLQCAIYAGVPAANSAFHMAEEVFAEMERQQSGMVS
jgi:3-oxoadipate enol-lactonase/4-carboxymuconolactone decarboxylase